MKKILIVDDEANIRKLAVSILSAVKDTTVLCAADGREGLQMAVQEHPDLIFLDIMMPLMDGPALAAALRENAQTQNIPVIFLTSLVAKDEEQKPDRGRCRYMAKPFDSKALLSTVEEVLCGG